MKLLLALLCLSGCASIDMELAARNRALYGPWCERMGNLEGTEGYNHCVLGSSMADEEQRKVNAPRQ